MSAVFREIKMTWGGREYVVTPTMRLLNRIEQDISLASLAHRLSTGHPPLSHLATVTAELLRSAGAKVTDEEVYQEMMLGDEKSISDMANMIILAIFPQSKEEQKQKKKTPSTAS